MTYLRYLDVYLEWLIEKYEKIKRSYEFTAERGELRETSVTITEYIHRAG
jgi:hypothetical protein